MRKRFLTGSTTIFLVIPLFLLMVLWTGCGQRNETRVRRVTTTETQAAMSPATDAGTESDAFDAEFAGELDSIDKDLDDVLTLDDDAAIAEVEVGLSGLDF